MSGECDYCGEHTLECHCTKGYYILQNACGPGCPCKQCFIYTHLQLVRNDMVFEGQDPPAEMPEVKYINVRGRREHEAVIKDAALCKELGLDQIYETIVYLKRWGDWLPEE